ncbi:MAG: signal recognition particle-docking protein FtsY [Bacteroidales bacterium]
MAHFSFFSKRKIDSLQASPLERGLKQTKENFLQRVSRVVIGKSKIDDDVLDKLEEALISSDIGVETTIRIIQRIENRVAREKLMNTGELNSILRQEIEGLLEVNTTVSSFNTTEKPYVILVVGVNGVGKTTTIGKLAAQFIEQGKKVYIGAADTFRAAAVDQLDTWAKRAGATIIKQNTGSDPAAVAFDTASAAKANQADIVLIDTAGRLHNKINLMSELTKIRNVIAKVINNAPHEVLLVLDGSTGQNAYRQAEEFSKATKITTLAITKLDGTAKGGVILGISEQLKIPVKYIGMGEKIEDLRIFDKKEFVETLFS